MFIEYRANGGSWQAAPEHKNVKEDDDYERVTEVWATGRNYDLFAKMAGVRGRGPEPKGLPDDVSDIVNLAADQWGGDGHSHSFMSLEEFEAVLRKCGYRFNHDRTDAFYEPNYNNPEPFKDAKDAPPDFTTVVNYGKKLRQEVSQIDSIILGDEPSKVDIRVVFWFDN